MLNDEQRRAFSAARKAWLMKDQRVGPIETYDHAMFAAGIAYAQTWRSMESAPKDGTLVLLINSGSHVVIGRFENGWRKTDYAFREPMFTYADVTHWMPLPLPPTQEAK